MKGRPGYPSSLCSSVPHPRELVSKTLFKKKIIYLFIFGCTGSLMGVHGLSLIAASGGSSLVVVPRLLQAVAPLVGGRKLQLGGRQYLQRTASAVAACGPWSLGSVVATLELSSPVACGIFPHQRWKDSSPLDHQGSPRQIFPLPPPCGSLGPGTGMSETVNLTRQAAWRSAEHPASAQTLQVPVRPPPRSLGLCALIQPLEAFIMRIKMTFMRRVAHSPYLPSVCHYCYYLIFLFFFLFILSISLTKKRSQMGVEGLERKGEWGDSEKLNLFLYSNPSPYLYGKIVLKGFT